MTESRIIDMLTNLYVEHVNAEPPQDAGQHPSLALHEQVGNEWAAWEAKGNALRLLLSAHLLRDHLDRATSRAGGEQE